MSHGPTLEARASQPGPGDRTHRVIACRADVAAALAAPLRVAQLAIYKGRGRASRPAREGRSVSPPPRAEEPNADSAATRGTRRVRQGHRQGGLQLAWPT